MPIECFLKDLDTIPWFQNVGKPINDNNVLRIMAWSDWPGPASIPTEMLHLRQQAFHDRVLAQSASLDKQLEDAWGEVQNKVLALASHALNDPLEGDAWDPISTAAWHAAWTACLVATYAIVGLAIPEEIAQQWNWFRKGHWPCAYTALDESNQPTGIIVF